MPGPDGRALRILVADDDQDTVMTTAMLLQDMGHQVDTAGSGAEALERARAAKPDLVLLDIGMPGLDGWQVASRLRESLGQSVMIVAVSGLGDPGATVRSRKAGFDAHVPKPIDMALLRSILGMARQRR